MEHGDILIMNLRCLAFFGFAVAIATTFFVGTLAVHEPQCVDFWGMVLQNIDPDSIVPDIVQNVLSKLFPEMDVQAIHQVQMVIEKDPGFMSAVDNVKIEFHKVEPMLRKGFCSFPVPVSGPCRLITEQYMKFSQEQGKFIVPVHQRNLD